MTSPGMITPGSAAPGPIGTLQCVVLDCPDVLELAFFYQRLLGGEINRPDPQWAVGDAWATLHDASGAPVLAFQGVADHRPPVWGAPEQQFHIDVRVADLDAADEAVTALGAQRLDSGAGDRSWRIYADPAGHPFCLVRH
ncbi:VOC family protein [Streptomyces sp. NPDC053431]|uniref:VOC family protein n=1 Tax=Streptomyces sp. NPDC053431 TaxID=3365703 RepID=UPI0037D0ECCB